MEFVGGLIVGGLIGWAITHWYYVKASKSAEKQTAQLSRNDEIMAEYLMRKERGENVEIIRGEPGTGLKGLNIKIVIGTATSTEMAGKITPVLGSDGPDEVQISENIVTVVKPEKDPDSGPLPSS